MTFEGVIVEIKGGRIGSKREGGFGGFKVLFPTGETTDVGSGFTDRMLAEIQIDPEKWIDRCTKGHADRIISQIEKMEDQMAFVEGVRESGAKAGLAIDLETPVSSLNESALMLTDVVIVLSVQAGFGGQPFHEESLTKIEELNDLRDKTGATFTICDDGGISLDTIALTSAHGVDSVAVGKRIFHGNLEENIDHFKKAAKG
jgi:ribulose-phosphate 3-epimerase